MEYNDVLTRLQHYMLTESHIVNSTVLKLVTPVEKPVEKHVKQYEPVHALVPASTIFKPREKDSLFWCFYIMKHGDIAYESLLHRNMILEKKLKIEYIERLRLDKDLVKPYKFASLSHIENKLANDTTIDLPTFLSLCVLENINVVFVKNRTYVELTMNDTLDFYIVYCFDNYKYGYEIDTNDTIDQIKERFFRLDNITKPIKSISSYKVSELVDMCTRLEIDINNTENKCKTKNELYEAIVKYF
jgi:hypothetical protein